MGYFPKSVEIDHIFRRLIAYYIQLFKADLEKLSGTVVVRIK